MKYLTAAAFRAALESHLLQAASPAVGASLPRLRKIVVFDRLLARLLAVAPDRWVVKGGVALDVRLGDRARATKDLDLAYLATIESLIEDLLAAQFHELDDFFTFSIEAHGVGRQPNQRFQVRAELAGRVFEDVLLDIGVETPTTIPETGYGRPLLKFAGIDEIALPILPLAQHTAEKVHAYTRLYSDGRPSSRVKDLVDLILIRSIASFESGRLRRALNLTFRQRGTHSLPRGLPVPPPTWAVAYRRAAQESGLDQQDLMAGFGVVAAFLDPVLSDEVAAGSRWNNVTMTW